MRKDIGRAHLEAADHANRRADPWFAHPVGVEGRSRLAARIPASSQAAKSAGGLVVAIGYLDHDGVGRVAGGQRRPPGLVDDVVRRSDQIVDATVGRRVTEAGKRLEAGHVRVPAPSPGCVMLLGVATWVLDLDGVVWLGDVAIAGSADAIARLRAGGHRVAFVTNNSSMTVDAYLEKFSRLEIPVDPADLITSAQAAAALLKPGERAVACAGPGVVEALEARGVEVVAEGPADAVVVGWHRNFDYLRLTAAVRAVLGGAILIGTNDDPTYPSPDGLLPGGGALLAAVGFGSGTTPTVAGKPYELDGRPHRRACRCRRCDGRRPSIDRRPVRSQTRAHFALVLSGITTAADLPVDPAPDSTTADVAALVAAL